MRRANILAHQIGGLWQGSNEALQGIHRAFHRHRASRNGRAQIIQGCSHGDGGQCCLKLRLGIQPQCISQAIQGIGVSASGIGGLEERQRHHVGFSSRVA